MIVKSENFIQNPIVSVVVITYNQEQYIRQCIESILTQETDFPFEIIIGEDCGTDSTRDICIEYQQKNPEKICLLLQEHNQGLIKNYRDVLSLCRGKYIAQCAGDDYWIDNLKIQKQAKLLSSRSEVVLVRTAGLQYNENTNQFKPWVNYCIDQEDVFEYSIQNNIVNAPSVMFKTLILKFIDFNEFEKRKLFIEDWPMWTIFASKGKFAFLPDQTCVYRISDKGLSHNIEKYIDFNIGISNVRKYFYDLFPEKCHYDENENLDFICIKKIRLAYLKHDFKLANSLSKEILTEEYKRKKFVTMSKNYFTFYFLILLKKIKNESLI